MKKIILLMMVLCLTQSGQAAVIKIGLIGQVDSVDDPYNLLDGSIHQGDLITGYYIYESTTPDSNLAGTVGDYWHYNQPFGIFLTAGGYKITTDSTNTKFLVEIVNDHGFATAKYDHYLLRSYNNLPLSNGTTVDHISWQLDDYSHAAISSTGLPVVPPDLAMWQYDDLIISGGKGGTPPCFDEPFNFTGHITSVYLIPEPGTLLLFMMGMVAISRKKSKTY